ncbi:MAG: Gfo/Idh/MocA family oxidoreductase [Chthonomonadales bacterium]|nr:Gfo/Idh/MocA family oxidoreductase [Chthonomonadales bacterium]
MSAVRLGVVGCGVIGRHHLRAASTNEHIDLVAVADRIADRRDGAAAEFGARLSLVEGAELVDSPEVDAVVLAVPAGDRMDLPELALRRRKHVLIEKPVAMNADAVRRTLSVRGDRVAACCSSRYRAHAATRAAAGLVATGALGPLRSVHCRSLTAAGPPPTAQPPPWRLSRERNAGGILTNWGCYDLDYLMTVTGWSLRPRTALARTWGVPAQYEAHVAPGSDAEAHYAAIILCDGGAALSLERGEYMAAAPHSSWRVIGERGSLRLTMSGSGEKTIWHDEADAADGVRTRVLWRGNEDAVDLTAGVLANFAAAILGGEEPWTDLARSLVVQQITDAIYASSASGGCAAIE